MKFLQGISNNPCFNLAFEEYFFNLKDGEDYFLLWQNDNAIIVGRHQNTIEEINQEYAKARQIQVVRRITGGGAVYHDLGNVNYSFITSAVKDDFDFRFFTRPIIEALSQIGIEAAFNSRNDLTIAGAKFSGNAQHIAGNRLLHHGTLLYNSNLEVLSKALRVKEAKIASKGIKSVKSRVTNIADHLPKAPAVEDFIALLKDFMFKTSAITEAFLTPKEITAINALKAARYDTWDWNYGKSPAYNMRKEAAFSGGLLTVLAQVEKGRFTEISLYGDFFGKGNICELEACLKGVTPEKEQLKAALKQVDVSFFIIPLTNDELITILLN